MSAARALTHRRFLRDDRGATAVEFAMVLTPLLLILFSIIEIAMIYVVSGSLEAAVNNEGRTIRTGEVQKNAQLLSLTPEQAKAAFKSSICGELSWLGTQCQTNLFIDVRTQTTFGTPSQTLPLKDGQLDGSQMQWGPGKAGDIVLIRAYYEWPLLTPWSSGMARTAAGGAVVTATTTFRNEPYT